MGSDATSTGEKSNHEQPQQNQARGRFMERLSGKTLPRMALDMRGLEWFVYNRSPAYDAVLAVISKSSGQSHVHSSHASERAGPIHPTSRNQSSVDQAKPEPEKTTNSSDPLHKSSPTESQDVTQNTSSEQALPGFLRLFPIGVVCKKAAMIMGNDATKSILVATSSGAEGLIDARAAGSRDNYKQCFDFALENFVIKFRKNESYTGSILESGAGQDTGNSSIKTPKIETSGTHTKSLLSHKIYSLIPKLRDSTKSLVGQASGKGSLNLKQQVQDLQGKWRGLSRYLDADEDDLLEHERWKSVEYAQISTIAEFPEITVSFSWDVPGIVRLRQDQNQQNDEKSHLYHINNGPAPEWGFDINIAGGTINYGPWADRQRADLQNVFFPSSYASATPTNSLQPGQQRQSTQFRINVTLDEAVNLRLYTREESKDLKWKNSPHRTTKVEQTWGKKANRKKREKGPLNSDDRPAAWLYLTAAANTSVSYTMDMMASTQGFSNVLQLDTPSVHLTTSVNHGTFIHSEAMLMTCDLSTPLKWNTLRTWLFNIMAHEVEVFFLRDHAFLLIDLINDWTSGPSNDFMTFIPFLYKFSLDLRDLKLHLNVNDANIIDVPASLNDNAYLLLGARRLRTVLDVPAINYRPQKNVITFRGDIDDLYLELFSPTWNTLHTLLKQKTLGKVTQLSLNGCYNYYTSNSPAQTDVLILNLFGDSLVLHIYGFLIRQFMILRDNYFGDDMHFQTLEEYQCKIAAAGIDTGIKTDHSSAKITNDLDVILTIKANEVCLILPSCIYSVQEHIKVNVPTIGLELRFTNYYMDLEVATGPLSFARGAMLSNQTSSINESNVQIFLDGLWLSGHRLFGLPPTEPTYVCNWDFNVGKLTGECSLDFVACLAAVGKAIAFQFRDIENALPRKQPKTIHDVTFLRLKTEPIDLWLCIEDSALQIRVAEGKLEFDDLAGELFSEHVRAEFPDVSIGIVDAVSAARQQIHHQEDIITHALLQSSISIQMVETAARFRAQRQLQQDHIMNHDSRTRRTPWLLLNDPRMPGHEFPIKPMPPAMPILSMPEPLRTSTAEQSSVSYISTSRSSSSGSVWHHNSFLNLTLPTAAKELSPLRSTARTKPKVSEVRRSISRSVSTSGEKPARLAFSSPYNTIQFQFQGVSPNSKNLPALKQKAPQRCNMEHSDAKLNVLEDEIVRSSIIISCGSGTVAFFTLEALSCMDKLIQSLQPFHASQILDGIQINALPKVPLAFNQPQAIKSTQIRLDLSQVAVRFITQCTSRPTLFRLQMYEAELSDVILIAEIDRKDASEATDSVSFSTHVSVGAMDIVISGRQDVSAKEEARLQVRVASSKGWLHSHRRIAGQISLDRLEIISTNRQVEHLAAIIRHILSVIEEVRPLFQSTAHVVKAREQGIVHFLCMVNQDLADPAFLNNASYIARATTEHARNSDTWKIISRLRYILYSLSASEHQEIESKLREPQSILEAAQVEEVIDVLNRWRGWDLEHLRTNAFMRQVFKFSVPQGLSEVFKDDISLRVNLETFVVMIDPGPSQNQVNLQGISFSTISTVEVMHTESGTTLKRTTSITLFCNETIVQLNWRILELVEGISRRSIKQHNNCPAVKEHSTTTQSLAAQKLEHNLQFITGFETIDINFEAINLEVSNLTRSLRSSTLLQQFDNVIIDISTILSADLSATKVSSNALIISIIQLLNPSSYGALEVDSSTDPANRKWTAVGLVKKLELEIQQDLLSLVGIADSFLRDEITYICSLLPRRHDGQTVEKADLPISLRPSVRNEFRVALLLENYRLSMAILSSFHYVLHGNDARSTIQATIQSQLELNTNFDVKQHVHTFENHTGEVIEEISNLSLPPINGEINLIKSSSLIRATFNISLEKIFLDASAVHALVGTFSRREIATYRKSISRDVTILESNFRSIFPNKLSSTGSKTSVSPNNFFYETVINAEGLSVKAVTSKSSKQPARLVLDIGPALMDFQNGNQERGVVLPFLNANAEAKEIKVLLERFNGHHFHECGDVVLGFIVRAGSAENEHGQIVRSIEASVMGPEISIYAETAPTIVDILGYIQQRFRDFSLAKELYTMRARRNRSKSIVNQPPKQSKDEIAEDIDSTATLFSSMFSIELSHVQVAWRVGELQPISPGHDVEDLVFSIESISLATRHANSAKLVMVNLQLQMVPSSQSTKLRSRNSALMPEVLFNVAYVSTAKDRRFAFQAVGKSVDLRVTPRFVLPAADLQRSIALATQDLRKVIADWNASFIQDEQNKKIIAAKKISSILIDADFAGAIVNLQTIGDVRSPTSPYSPSNIDRHVNDVENGVDCGSTNAMLKTPGIAFKVEYSDVVKEFRALNAEIKIDASSNTLQPSIVPLILELTNSVREVVHEKDDEPSAVAKKTTLSTTSDDEIISNPVAILGDCKLNLGLRICRQKFGLSCQPIAKVEARTEFEDIYITINTVQINEHDRFFSLSAKIQKLQASVRHTYSQEATGKFVADYIELSLMNSRHVSNMRGISAILSFGPMKFLLNVRQLHDFLLFKEIWLPEELKQTQTTPTPPLATDEPQVFMIQRYQQVATASPFPWNATIAISNIDGELDFGQSLGKSSFQISHFWTASRKVSNWEQNLHLGFDKIQLKCMGRLSCYLGLENMALRTFIRWPEVSETSQQIPLVQASMSFEHFKIKAAFEYQAFLIGNFSSLKFLMYNVREGAKTRDRLVCTIDGDKVQAYCTTQSSASAIALHQAVQRLIQEKKQSFENSLRDIRRYYHRTKIDSPSIVLPRRIATELSLPGDKPDRAPMQLQTNVVISLKSLNVGAYPRSFADGTIFKLDALDAQAKFSVLLKDKIIHSSLGMGLGQVRVALSNVNRGLDVSSFEDMLIDDIVKYATSSRGGTILKVPQANANMQTWHTIGSTSIDYIFQSSFEGKVEVGWNINRINVIRTMWNNHSKALSSRLGKALPQSAVQITGVPTEDSDGTQKQDKITAVVNVPLSRYTYTAREPAIIETPQLRDMGEATPPLEWIGLQRDRLPNLTHQIIIVPLLEIAKEVEDAYGKILGVS